MQRAMTCKKCGSVVDRTSARQKYCKTCCPNQEARHRLRRYGVSPAEVAALLAEQGGLCKLCGERVATCVDHNHRSGIVRGMLCATCNMVLHFFEDDNWMDAAKEYLNAIQE